MKRRDFLRNAMIGTTALLSGDGLSASNLLPSKSANAPSMLILEAAVGGHWHIVKEWLRRDPSLINVTGKARLPDVYKLKGFGVKMTLLHLAASYNSVDILDLLRNPQIAIIIWVWSGF